MSEDENHELEESEHEQLHHDKQRALQVGEQALRLVSLNLPWLSPLVYAVNLVAEPRIHIAAVSQTGRVFLNPTVFSQLPLRQATYIMAHELLHLALDTFSRESEFDDPETVNIAHDYIINDLLRKELHMDPPLNGLKLHGASEWSLEKVVTWMKEDGAHEPRVCWQLDLREPEDEESSTGNLGAALREAGLLRTDSPQPSRSKPLNPRLDVIFPKDERRWFPDSATPKPDVSLRNAVLRTLELNRLSDTLRSDSGGGTGHGQLQLGVAKAYGLPPWERAMQRWLEALAPGDRSYARPSRRGADRTDCVLPGRKREGWTLHMVLDTSGSMLNELPSLLATIKAFCLSVGVKEVHLIQCGDTLTGDDWVPTEDLDQFKLIGGGGGNLIPGFERLAQDPEVESAIIITDTYERYPEETPHFDVLWAVIHNRRFQPPYGIAIFIDTEPDL